jgi:recombinational DNA repair protein (RecF pathway)
MAGPGKEVEALVLDREEAGERYLRFHLLCPADGPINALWRRSTKPRAPSPPDLFCRIEAHLQPSSRSKAFFLNECRTLRAYAGIARHYASLQEASAFARLLWRNLTHAEFFEPLYQLSCDALEAFEEGHRPEVVHFKALYRLARDEGYPVKEEWWANLPEKTRGEIVSLVQHPAKAHPIAPETARAHLRSLQHYLRYSTDIVVPANGP